MRYSTLLQALNGILAERYPEIKRYGSDTTEGWQKPYFFVECVPFEGNYQTKNFYKKSCSLKITYFQLVNNELDQLEKVEEIRDVMGMKLSTEGRHLDIRDFIHDFVGEYENILQISFRLEWFENRYRGDEGEKMKTVDMALGKGE